MNKALLLRPFQHFFTLYFYAMRIHISLLMYLLSLPLWAQERTLVWSDEFDYTGLPDTAKWTYEHGFVRNQEQQYYTFARPENVWVHDGLLEIKGRKEVFPNAQYQKGSTDWRTKDSLAHYTSTSLISLGKGAWQYGRVEVRAKIPTGKGIWPAIWMLGNNREVVNWPECGEIDIMEYVGSDTTHVYGTIHFPKTDGNGSQPSGGNIAVQRPYDAFHLYAIDWDADYIKVFFDDQLYHTFPIKMADQNGKNPFRLPFYVLINLAMGANWPGPIDDSILPKSYWIDYVRVYR